MQRFAALAACFDTNTHSHALHNAIHDGAPRLAAALNDPSAEDVGTDECAKEGDALLGGMAR